MPHDISWTLRNRTTSFLCPVVERWESAKIAHTSARRWEDVVGSGGSGGAAADGVAEDARLDDTALCPDVLRGPVDTGPLVARAGISTCETPDRILTFSQASFLVGSARASEMAVVMAQTWLLKLRGVNKTRREGGVRLFSGCKQRLTQNGRDKIRVSPSDRPAYTRF